MKGLTWKLVFVIRTRSDIFAKGIILVILGDIEQIEILGSSRQGAEQINLKKKVGWTLMKTSPPPFTFQLAWDPIRGEWTSRTSSNLMADQRSEEVSQKDDGRDMEIKLLSPNSSGSMSSKIFLFILGEPGKYPT